MPRQMRAFRGDRPRASARDIDTQNEGALVSVDGMSGEHAVAELAEPALSFLAKADANWDVPNGQPSGELRRPRERPADR